MQIATQRTRITADTPLVVGMVLADEDGGTVTVHHVNTRIAVVNSLGGFSHDFVRARWPFLAADTDR